MPAAFDRLPRDRRRGGRERACHRARLAGRGPGRGARERVQSLLPARQPGRGARHSASAEEGPTRRRQPRRGHARRRRGVAPGAWLDFRSRGCAARSNANLAGPDRAPDRGSASHHAHGAATLLPAPRAARRSPHRADRRRRDPTATARGDQHLVAFLGGPPSGAEPDGGGPDGADVLRRDAVPGRAPGLPGLRPSVGWAGGRCVSNWHPARARGRVPALGLVDRRRPGRQSHRHGRADPAGAPPPRRPPPPRL